MGNHPAFSNWRDPIQGCKSARKHCQRLQINLFHTGSTTVCACVCWGKLFRFAWCWKCPLKYLCSSSNSVRFGHFFLWRTRTLLYLHAVVLVCIWMTRPVLSGVSFIKLHKRISGELKFLHQTCFIREHQRCDFVLLSLSESIFTSFCRACTCAECLNGVGCSRLFGMNRNYFLRGNPTL